jgi:hypothetical protein
VLDAFAVEQLGECSVVGVAPRVVGEDASDRDPVASIEREGVFHERDDRAGALVGVELAEREPGMVIDGCVGVVLAEMLALILADSRAVPRDRMPGRIEARIGLDVDVQQVSRAGPLVAVRCLPRLAWAPRQAVTVKDLPDR